MILGEAFSQKIPPPDADDRPLRSVNPMIVAVESSPDSNVTTDPEFPPSITVDFINVVSPFTKNLEPRTREACPFEKISRPARWFLFD